MDQRETPPSVDLCHTRYQPYCLVPNCHQQFYSPSTAYERNNSEFSSFCPQTQNSGVLCNTSSYSASSSSQAKGTLNESYLGIDKSKAPPTATLQHDNIDSSLLKLEESTRGHNRNFSANSRSGRSDVPVAESQSTTFDTVKVNSLPADSSGIPWLDIFLSTISDIDESCLALLGRSCSQQNTNLNTLCAPQIYKGFEHVTLRIMYKDPNEETRRAKTNRSGLASAEDNGSHQNLHPLPRLFHPADKNVEIKGGIKPYERELTKRKNITPSDGEKQFRKRGLPPSDGNKSFPRYTKRRSSRACIYRHRNLGRPVISLDSIRSLPGNETANPKPPLDWPAPPPPPADDI